MQDVEEMMITHGEDVAAAVRAEPAALKERMRTTPLDESSGWTRWKQLCWYAMLMVSIADGVVGYTNFIVDLIIRKLDKTHRGHNQREALDEDVLLEGVLGNTRVRAKFMKKLKDYKGAPISQFRFAKVMGGMTQRGFNALRFAMHGWAPGTARMLKDLYAYLRHLTSTYCKAGEDIESGMSPLERAEAEAAAVNAEAELVTEEDRLDDDAARDTLGDAQHAAGVDETVRVDDAEHDKVAIDIDQLHAPPVEEQVLNILREAYPADSFEDLQDKWKGTSNEGVFEGSLLIHVLVRAPDGRVKGFIKGLLLAFQDELYIWEVAVAGEDRGQKLLQHLVVRLIDACESRGKKVARVRLQCLKGTKLIGGREVDLRKDVYAPMGIGIEWAIRKSGVFEGVAPDPPDLYVMLWGQGKDVRKAATAQRDKKPLAEGVHVSVHYGGYNASEDEYVGADGMGMTAEQVEHVQVATEIEAERTEAVAPDDGNAAGRGWGATTFINALAMALIPIMFMINGSILQSNPYSKVGVNISADAATLRHAPKNHRKNSTAMLRLLAWGVTKGNWGARAVQYMIPGAMSAIRAFKLRNWEGDDGRTNLTKHFAPYIDEALKMTRSKGIEVDGLLKLPPWYWVQNADGSMRRVDLPTRTKPGTSANLWAEDEREVFVTGIIITIALIVSGDGAMLQSLTGTCGISEEKADLFSGTKKSDMSLLLHVVARAPGESVLDVLERLHPGSCDETSRDAWVKTMAPIVNKHSLNAALQSTTREPEEADNGHAGGGANVGGMSSAAAKKKQQLMGAGASDGRVAIKKKYRGNIAKVPYDHRAFVPGIDGDDDDFLTSTSTVWTLIRLPVVPDHFGKTFSPLWDVDTFGALGDEIGGCLMHGGMRSGEGNEEWMLKGVIDRFMAGKGKDQETVKTHLNKALIKNIDGWHRNLVQTDSKGNLVDFKLNGSDVKVLFTDIRTGDESEFFKAVRNVHEKLGIDPTTAHLDEWEKVLSHWANAMDVGYKLAPTDDDRKTFATEVRFYVLKKALIKNDGMRWYDWQFWSIFPKLLDTFGSLRLISQETVEAQMALNNQHMTRSNGFSNAGARLKEAVHGGVEKLKEYMARRAANARSMWRWLWERQLVSWMAPVHEVFDRMEARKAKGEAMPFAGDDYTDAYEPAHRSFETISPTALKLLGRSRAKGKDRPQIVELRKLVQQHLVDLPEDVEKYKEYPEADKYKELQKARKKRWAAAKGEGSGKQLLHTPLALEEHTYKAHLLRLFGANGVFPMPYGRQLQAVA